MEFGWLRCQSVFVGSCVRRDDSNTSGKSVFESAVQRSTSEHQLHCQSAESLRLTGLIYPSVSLARPCAWHRLTARCLAGASSFVLKEPLLHRPSSSADGIGWKWVVWKGWNCQGSQGKAERQAARDC